MNVMVFPIKDREEAVLLAARTDRLRGPAQLHLTHGNAELGTVFHVGDRVEWNGYSAGRASEGHCGRSDFEFAFAVILEMFSASDVSEFGGGGTGVEGHRREKSRQHGNCRDTQEPSWFMES